MESCEASLKCRITCGCGQEHTDEPHPISLLRPRNVFLYAFDLLELDGKDLRLEPLEVRKSNWLAYRGLLPRIHNGVARDRRSRSRPDGE